MDDNLGLSEKEVMEGVMNRFLGSTLGCLILVGIGYAAFTLFAPAPARASSCDCNEEQIDATQFCLSRFGRPEVAYFECPFFGQQYDVECAADPNLTDYVIACD